jgi:hypothetical protein
MVGMKFDKVTRRNATDSKNVETKHTVPERRRHLKRGAGIIVETEPSIPPYDTGTHQRSVDQERHSPSNNASLTDAQVQSRLQLESFAWY